MDRSKERPNKPFLIYGSKERTSKCCHQIWLEAMKELFKPSLDMVKAEKGLITIFIKYQMKQNKGLIKTFINMEKKEKTTRKS